MKKPSTSGVNAGSFSLSKTGVKKSSADGQGNNLSNFSLEKKSIPTGSGIVNQTEAFGFGPDKAVSAASQKSKLK